MQLKVLAALVVLLVSGVAASLDGYIDAQERLRPVCECGPSDDCPLACGESLEPKGPIEGCEALPCLESAAPLQTVEGDEVKRSPRRTQFGARRRIASSVPSSGALGCAPVGS